MNEMLSCEITVSQGLHGRTTVSDVETLYGALDIFVLPAHIEEFGRVSLEAMACGTPVLLSSTTGAAELLEADHGDLILDSRDTGAWADRLERLLEEDLPARGSELSRLMTNYSYRCQTEKLRVSFEELTRQFPAFRAGTATRGRASR